MPCRVKQLRTIWRLVYGLITSGILASVETPTEHFASNPCSSNRPGETMFSVLGLLVLAACSIYSLTRSSHISL